MNIHEYQAKQVLRDFGVPTPKGIPAFNPDEAVKAAQQLGGPVWVVKAQIHAGGRGKGKFKEESAGPQGGVRIAKSIEEAEAFARQMLGATLVIVEAQRSGLTPELGADGVLIGIARGANKPVREIETIDEQFKVLAGGSAKEQAADLMELIDALQSGEELSELGALAQAWLAADLAGLEAALDRLRSDPRASAQRSVDLVIIGRNRAMAERIEGMLAREPVLAAVGALHLVGKDSVIEELTKRGWTVKRR